MFSRIIQAVEGYDKLSDMYPDPVAMAAVLRELQGAALFGPHELPQYFDNGSLLPAGRELVENALIGKAFASHPDAVRQAAEVPSLRLAVVSALPEIARNSRLAKNGYDLGNQLAAAVDLVYRARRADPSHFGERARVSEFALQMGLFDDPGKSSDVNDAMTLMLADMLNSGKPPKVRAVLADYNRAAARAAAAGQLDMFSDTGQPTTPQHILTEILRHYGSNTNIPRPEPTATETLPPVAGNETERNDIPLTDHHTVSQQRATDNTTRTQIEPVEAQGRSLDKNEAESLIEALVKGAERVEEIPLTIQNWDAQFGDDGKVTTPIENVTMGENQFTKLMRRGRNSKLGMVRPTLENPDIVIADASKAKGEEKYLSPFLSCICKNFCR